MDTQLLVEKLENAFEVRPGCTRPLDIHTLYCIGDLQHCPRQNYVLVSLLISVGLEERHTTWDVIC